MKKDKCKMCGGEGKVFKASGKYSHELIRCPACKKIRGKNGRR